MPAACVHPPEKTPSRPPWRTPGARFRLWYSPPTPGPSILPCPPLPRPRSSTVGGPPNAVHPCGGSQRSLPARAHPPALTLVTEGRLGLLRGARGPQTGRPSGRTATRSDPANPSPPVSFPRPLPERPLNAVSPPCQSARARGLVGHPAGPQLGVTLPIRARPSHSPGPSLRGR